MVTTRSRVVCCEVVHATAVEEARVGIADGELAASLAARSTEVIVVPPGESAAFLAPWSIGVVAPHVEGGIELADLLVRLGLRTLGAFAELPEPSVLARFGLPGVHAHRLARGEGVQGGEPMPIPPELVETVELDPPAVRVDEAAFAAKMLADRLLGHLDELGLSCSRVMVEAETEHGERMTRLLATRRRAHPGHVGDPGAVAARGVAQWTRHPCGHARRCR